MMWIGPIHGLRTLSPSQTPARPSLLNSDTDSFLNSARIVSKPHDDIIFVAHRYHTPTRHFTTYYLKFYWRAHPFTHPNILTPRCHRHRCRSSRYHCCHSNHRCRRRSSHYRCCRSSHHRCRRLFSPCSTSCSTSYSTSCSTPCSRCRYFFECSPKIFTRTANHVSLFLFI